MNDKIKITDIIEDMENILNEATNFPLSKRVGIDKEDMLSLIDELKEALPYELNTAIKIIDEQDQILTQAKSDAEFIVSEAKRQRDELISQCNDEISKRRKQVDKEIEHMMAETTAKAEELINESKITKDAKVRADKMIGEAKRYSRDMREGAVSYSKEQLETVEVTLSSILQEVVKNKNSL